MKITYCNDKGKLFGAKEIVECHQQRGDDLMTGMR